MENKIIVGPILGFRGMQDGSWCTSALLVTQGNSNPPHLTYTSTNATEVAATPVLLKQFENNFCWRMDWSVRQTEEEQQVEYTVNRLSTFRYVVPGQKNRFRICYGSCFGVSIQKDINKVRNKNKMWKVLAQVHQEEPYHLFFLGGDQIYSDQVWDFVEPLKKWLSKKLKKRLLEPFTPDMEQQVNQFYFKLYIQIWSQKRPAAILSQIPTLMMWDDHDIFDGWGSYMPKQQACAVFQGVYKIARENFRLFQLQANDEFNLERATILGADGFTYAYQLGELALVALDLRSERTQNRVMLPETWERLHGWLDKIKNHQANEHNSDKRCRHLLVMSGIPIVNADLTLLETALNIKPGHQRMEDDLRDQWLSKAHQQERLQFIRKLFVFSQEAACRVTIISGDAHVAFTGILQSHKESGSVPEATIINQFTSSAMVNLPPPALVIYMMEKLLAGKREILDKEITAHLSKFPGASRRIISARNFLSLSIDEQAKLKAEWFVEGMEKPFTKEVYPVGARSA
ncbi:alkaline phosphatase D family protein [Adhaeribacter aquaticus]|uniref:alkaline phosphatase D family protein n=1 Tax=Adhaeribacter aquaticus TaxID=299567 RepID=UPI0012F95F32|nr:alkaline phosphatase D family protein [Adhaeribacter aquaticus]